MPCSPLKSAGICSLLALIILKQTLASEPAIALYLPLLGSVAGSP
ncbi:MAG TPA: hypothetical protein V6D33_03730 [Cyanophyceae cyanobacterium]